MNDVRITILVGMDHTNPEKFRDTLVSLAAVDYTNWEAFFLCATGNYMHIYQKLAGEVFPRDGRIHFREIQLSLGEGEMSMARAYNVGLRHVSGDYIFLLGQHDLLAPDIFLRVEETVTQSLYKKLGRLKSTDNALEELKLAASKNKLRGWKETAPDLIYTDHDEIIGGTRMNPHFKSGWNLELLLQYDYIDCGVFMSLPMMRRIGYFNEDLSDAELYEYLLRIGDNVDRSRICRIPLLLYHQSIRELPEGVFQTFLRRRYESYVKVVEKYLRTHQIQGQVKKDPMYRFWRIKRKGNDYRFHKKEYIYLKDPDVKVKARKALPLLYSHIKEPDVAVVAAKLLQSDGRIDNVGFFYDEEGLLYPACKGQSSLSDGYANRIALSQEISVADTALCMIDAAVYKKLRGFRTNLSGNDRMLDFCLRARAAGYRVIYEPLVVGKKTASQPRSSELSHQKIRKLYGPDGSNSRIRLSDGDPYYDSNLSFGGDNYSLY